MNFVADRTLGKLAKWLRILGYDTEFYRGNIDLKFLKDAQKNCRTVLTRKRSLINLPCPDNVLVVLHDRLPDQLMEVSERFSLTWERERYFVRCVRCNELLQVIDKEEVKDCLSDHVWQNNEYFKKCSSCGGIFWPGTHHENSLSFIKNRNLSHHP